MVNVQFSTPPVFGCETKRCNANDFYQKHNWSENDIKILPHKRIAGYFFLLSTVAGISRIVMAIRLSKTTTNSFKARMIVRGVMEILNLGPILAITDLFITLHRR